MVTNSGKISGIECNLFYHLQKRASNRKNLIAFIGDGGQGRSYTYEETIIIPRKIAAGLQKHSLLQKKEIGLISENRPEWGLAYLSILAAGGTVVPIDANLKENEIKYIADHSKLEVIFTSSKFETIFKAFDRPMKIFSFDEKSPDYFESLLNNQEDSLVESHNDIAVLIYTSGTTGDPKAVELTHENILSNLIGIESTLHVNEKDIFLSVLPLHHTFEATCGFLTPLWVGAKIVYARSLKSKEILEDIGNNKITVMCGVPLLYEKMFHSINRGINNAPASKRIMFKTLYSISVAGWKLGRRWGKDMFLPLRKKAGLGSIRMFVSGGAAVPSRIAAFFNHLGFEFLQGYGMTETSPVLTFQRPEDIKFGSVGKPLETVELKINNPNKNGIGEIIARGDNITPGYRNNPEKTAELIKDGWLYTGDLGCIKKGHLWITGRAKNLIISAAGKNIYPEEIEDKLHESNLVLEAVVFGRMKKEKQGEDVLAIIVPNIEELKTIDGFDLKTADNEKLKKIIGEVVNNVNSQMADYKRISSFEVQLDELEKTSTKKVKRFLYK